MKITKTQLSNLAEINERGGVILASKWVTGRGRYVTKRAIPPFCDRIEHGQAYKFPKWIQKFFEKHPRCKAVIAITNLRAANKLLKGE